jgi:carbamoyl-phosphate synthase/aspartate carbamoyltransferase
MSSSPSSSSFDVSIPAPLDASVAIGHFKGRSILSTTQFSRVELNRIFSVAHHMSDVHLKGPGMLDVAKGKILTTLFYEPSTRTASSFHCAMLRLGGQVLPVQDVANSSVSKGETLEDTVRCLQCYTDVIVLRHPQVRKHNNRKIYRHSCALSLLLSLSLFLFFSSPPHTFH